MTAREKLIELIASTEYGNGSLVGENFQEGFIAKIADNLIANGVTVTDTNVGKWISVTERLPEIQQRILVYCESKTTEMHVTSCTYMGGCYGHKQFSRHVRNVTNWMPLPEPPKGE